MTASERIRAARNARERPRLMAEAGQAARRRGHTLSVWKTPDYWTETRMATCTDCGRSVYIDPSPPPNGIDISGEAVALNCTD